MGGDCRGGGPAHWNKFIQLMRVTEHSAETGKEGKRLTLPPVSHHASTFASVRLKERIPLLLTGGATNTKFCTGYKDRDEEEERRRDKQERF